MLTSMNAPAMTLSRPSVVLSAIDNNAAVSFVDVTTGVKRHADYGTGPDLAPGGAH
jgi:hypothetical protein